jgi:hypothetical protein
LTNSGERATAAAVERMMKPKQDVISVLMAKKISWLDAAENIGVCDRTMRRRERDTSEFGCTPEVCAWEAFTGCQME